MNQAETLLEIKDLCVEFKTMAGTVRAVDHLSYSLKRVRSLALWVRAEAERVFLPWL